MKDSNMISAVYSRFSGVLRGGSVWTHIHTHVYRDTLLRHDWNRWGRGLTNRK